MKRVMMLMVVLTTVGCADRYRYACQDPTNWNNTECNPPICSASGTCTEMTLRQTKCE